MNKVVVKQQVKSIISICLTSLLCNLCFAQTKGIDSVAFKNDFEKLLSRYGLNNENYLISVTSYNQKGGQTAFIINNNYYGDPSGDSSNVHFEIITEGGVPILYVSPKNGSWVAPFVMADSVRAMRPFFDPGAGLVRYFGGLMFTDTITKKQYALFGSIPNGSASRSFPLRITLTKDDPNEFFIFGDFDNINKTYYYKNRKVSWCPRPRDP